MAKTCSFVHFKLTQILFCLVDYMRFLILESLSFSLSVKPKLVVVALTGLFTVLVFLKKIPRKKNIKKKKKGRRNI